MVKDPNPFVITERFGVLPTLWGVAILSLGGAMVLRDRSPGIFVLSRDDMWMLLLGLLLIAWEIVRRWRRATVHVQGEAVEVFRRGVRVASVQRVDIVPWSTRKNVSDIGRSGILVFIILLVGGLIIILETGSSQSLVIGGAIIALGLGTAASLSYTLFWHWSVDVPNARSWIPWMPLMLTFRRADMRRLLDGEYSTRPFLEVIRAIEQGRLARTR